jgi:formate-dependent nitrite reductase membrane component NrfD
VLLTTVLLALFLTIVNYLEAPQVSSRVKKAAEVLCALSSLLLIGYVGVFLQSIWTVPFWSSYAIPALFVLSSVSLGMALMFLVTSFSSSIEWLNRRMVQLHIGHVTTLLLEAVALAVLVAQSTLNATALRSLDLLFGPDLQLWFVVGALGFGIALPLVAELYSILSKKVLLLPAAQILCLLGGFCLRYCIVSAGVH